MTNVKKVKAFCNECNKITNQNKYITVKREVQYDESSNQNFEYSLIQCLGCDFVGLYEYSTIDDHVDDKGELEGFIEIYPKSYLHDDEGIFLLEDEQDSLPRLINNLYDEVAETIDAELKVMSGIGLRTLIEAVCIHQKIKGRTLQLKIEKLHGEGWVSTKDLPILHKLREIGNSSAHEIKSPTLTTISNALVVVNHLLRSVYVVPKKSKRLR